jgi:hypothetical protein
MKKITKPTSNNFFLNLNFILDIYATPKSEQSTIFHASFDAAVGSCRMADSAKLLMGLDLLGGEPKKIAQWNACEEYNTRSYNQV